MNNLWSTEKINDWHNQHQWIIGCNFLPSTAVNDIEMWQKNDFDIRTIEKELSFAQNIGLNSVRIFLNYLVWQDNPEEFKERLNAFLNIAETNNLSVIPILFDDCNFGNKEAQLGKQPNPVPGVHNSQWVSNPPLAMIDDLTIRPSLKAYVKDIITSFKNDDRIIIWDLYNEPGNSDMKEKSLSLVEDVCKWAREINPIHPLTIAPWENYDEPMQKRIFELSDIISFHCYENLKAVDSVINICKKYERPIICTEWLHRQSDNRFDNILPLLRQENIGCYNWGLVEGKTQTYMHWFSEPGTEKPELWQHDLLYQDGSPFDFNEINLIKGIKSL